MPVGLPARTVVVIWGKTVADIIDEAHEREEALRNEAIRLAANQISAQTNLTGLCRVCGEPINPRRLAVMPTAQTCVECV